MPVTEPSTRVGAGPVIGVEVEERLEVATDRLRVEVKYRKGLGRVTVSGALDASSAGEFTWSVWKAFCGLPAAPLVLDLSGLTFVDTRGARTLAATVYAIPAARRVSIHRCQQPPVRRVLDQLDLDMAILRAKVERQEEQAR